MGGSAVREAGTNEWHPVFETIRAMTAQGKKREWFDLGARAYAQASPGTYAMPTYVCPVCRKPFTVQDLAESRLSIEHVPPRSVGGRELLLTCVECNNTAGTKLDASAKTKEEVRRAMAGRADRPHRVKAAIGGITLNGQLHTKDGSYSLTVPKHLNKSGTNEVLQQLARAGTSLTVEHEWYSELGARISWLRAGYDIARRTQLLLTQPPSWPRVAAAPTELRQRSIVQNRGVLPKTLHAPGPRILAHVFFRRFPRGQACGEYLRQPRLDL